MQRWIAGLVLLVGLGLIGAGLFAERGGSNTLTEVVPTPTKTQEPIIPTVTPRGEVLVETPTPQSVSSQSNPTSIPATEPFTSLSFERAGISGNVQDVPLLLDNGIAFRHWLDWTFRRKVEVPDDAVFWRTIKTFNGTFNNPTMSLAPVLAEVRRNPGEKWIVGNEPDVKWQDFNTPEQFARLYHEAYTGIKAIDPTAEVGVGAISQATPLRLRYLDRVLSTYEAEFGEPMPSDFWTLHTYTLREELGSWGVDIPPGMDVTEGELYEIEDHDSLEIFTENLLRFRRWMAENGYREQALIVTEFGILLPFDYGFPEESVSQFMLDTFDILLNMTDEEVGNPLDENRLVQVSIWFIAWDDQYNSGSLVNRETGGLTMLGETYRSWIASE